MKDIVVIIIIVVWAFAMNGAIHNSNEQLHNGLEKISVEHENIVAQEQETQSKIIEEGKTTILENDNKATKSFMFAPENGHSMRTDTKKEIINFAGEHGWVVSSMDGNRGIVFEKKGER